MKRKDVVRLISNLDAIKYLTDKMYDYYNLEKLADLETMHWRTIKIINERLHDELQYYIMEAYDWINSSLYSKENPIAQTTDKPLFWDKESFIDYLAETY